METKKIIAVWIPLIFWMALILYLSVFSAMQTDIAIMDISFMGSAVSWTHIPAYFVLSFLILRLFAYGEILSKNFTISITISSFYGIVMEFLQLFSEGRSFSFIDMVLNFFGSCMLLIFIPEGLKKIPGMSVFNKT